MNEVISRTFYICVPNSIRSKLSSFKFSVVIYTFLRSEKTVNSPAPLPNTDNAQGDNIGTVIEVGATSSLTLENVAISNENDSGC